MSKENLQTVANYAKSHNCSPTWVYQLIKDKKVEMKEIDGVKFIVVGKKSK